MEKKHLDRRLDQMRREGTVFRAGVDVGPDDLTADRLRDRYDAVVLAMGATDARDLPIPGRELGGHPPGDGLPAAGQPGRRSARRSTDQVTATGKNVVIIGGGDTGADCLGTSTRQGAASITQLEIMPEPPESRPAGQPWPTYPMTFRVSSAHEEAGERGLLGLDQGVPRRRRRQRPGAPARRRRASRTGRFEEVEGSEREIPAELVLFAMGFVGPEKPGLVEQLGVDLDERGNVARGKDYQTSVRASSSPATPAAASP